MDTLERFRSVVHSRERNTSTPISGKLVSKSHRIVFAVEKKEKRFYVVYVRHARRRAVGEAAGDEADE